MAHTIPFERPRVVSPFIVETFDYVVLTTGFLAFCTALWIGVTADAIQRGLHLVRGEDPPHPDALITPQNIAPVIPLADYRRR